jgi:hypothetical protein
MSTIHRREYQPATRDIREVFAEEISALGGTVPDVFEDGERLLARAVLPPDVEIRPGDHVRAGVAVRAAGPAILVHPYTFRLVCTNGAIAAHALASRRVERCEGTSVGVPERDVWVSMTEFRTAVRACAVPQVFATVAAEMRSATEVEADLALQLLPALRRMPQHVVARVLPSIVARFEAGGDRSAFGLMNAVTSVARDVREPETRWRLEELGGTTPARLRPKPRIAPPASVLAGV